MKKKKTEKREKPIPEAKKKLVQNIVEKMLKNKTILIASTKGLPASQFQSIKKKLRGKAEIVIARKSMTERAIDATKKESLQKLKECLQADIVLIFSGIDSFSLASELIDNQSPTKARVGDIAPEDITIEPGPTDLMPGPAISELGSVGIKVSVEGGKLAIKQATTIVKKGEIINEKVASVLGKLKIEPMKVGFIPLAAYDAKDDIIYKEIKIDKKGTLEELRNSIKRALGFAINIKYATKETISYFIAKARREEMAIEKIVESKTAGEGQ